ncbi:hypothetical protein LTR36_006749 [Oleoguttula mirabilis]|uniref:Urea transporter n=1 Tax=Oleoguttula mirabilis TaxID=1507867 RepID=A0AAV9JBK5_9PEZI|nr:hypothetical protein LTR36_006749 [Oleoguttula mirabilis]
MGTFQILLFALIAIKIKANAPGAHTFPEIVLARHGRVAHITYLFNGLATNLLVGACLVLGGSQVVAAVTGMSVYAACFLIPLVVAAYVIAGGLRSTFIADYASSQSTIDANQELTIPAIQVHTVVLFVAIFVFGFLVYATSDLVGSPSKLYDLLEHASKNMPIPGNVDESYLSFRSVEGLVFAIDLFAAGFSTVWLDQAYWQRAIASKPETSVRAYLLGGIAWYGIPFGFATAMGLGCAALTDNPRFPTYPNPLSAAQNGAGLSSPATAITLLGQGGAVLMLVLLFMAVTSSTSAELIAVSSLLTFDVYKTYVKPDASSARLVQISHYGICIYALVLAAFCSILNAVGLNLTWLLTILAIIVGGASIPVGLILLWKRMSTIAAVASPWIGLVCGLIAWFITTWKRSGSITVETSGNTINAVAGNVTSWGVGFLMSGVLTLAFPAKFASTDPKHIERSNNIQGISVNVSAVDSPAELATDGEKRSPGGAAQPASAPEPESYVPTGNDIVDFLERKNMEPMDPVAVKKAERLAIGANLVFFFIAIILVPFTLFGSRYIYSKAFFTGWVVVSFFWVWCSMTICVIYPIVESTGALKEVSIGIWNDFRALFGGKKPKAAETTQSAA